ncbi:MAG: histidine kinase, partial [Clostridia bacterium]|nr:histidine kinase [Clostridia bacterium]
AENTDAPVIYGKMDQNGLLFEEEDKKVALSVYKTGQKQRAARQLKWSFFPIATHNKIYAVIGVYTKNQPLDSFDADVVSAVLIECAIVLESNYNKKEKEQALLLAKDEQLRSNLLRSISHDLRSPLTSISGNASNLISNGKYFDDEAKLRIYSDIYDDSMWLINLVENILSITRLEEDKMNLPFSIELLDEIVDEAVRHIKKNTPARKITVELPDDMLFVKIDARLIAQVVVNLVDNAIKYSPSDSEICVRVSKKGNKAVVSVADHGNGIPDEMKTKVFDMFFTGEKRTADGRRGLGLGLALCKSIVNAHGGEITVSNNSPQGAIFSFTLPISEETINE